jgi:hypothetical protein
MPRQLAWKAGPVSVGGTCSTAGRSGKAAALVPECSKRATPGFDLSTQGTNRLPIGMPLGPRLRVRYLETRAVPEPAHDAGHESIPKYPTVAALLARWTRRSV